MKSFKPRSTTMTVLVAAVVLVVFGGGSAVAGGLITSAKIKNNTIQSIDVHDGSLTGVDIKDSSLTGADVKDGSLSHNDTGVYFAVVGSNGALIHSSGGVTVTKLSGNGVYQVDFHRSLLNCAFTAAVGDAATGAEEGQANVAYRLGNANAVWVETHTPDGATSSNRSFHLIVAC